MRILHRRMGHTQTGRVTHILFNKYSKETECMSSLLLDRIQIVDHVKGRLCQSCLNAMWRDWASDQSVFIFTFGDVYNIT